MITWILVLTTISAYSHAPDITTSVPGFMSEASCTRGGEKWAANVSGKTRSHKSGMAPILVFTCLKQELTPS